MSDAEYFGGTSDYGSLPLQNQGKGGLPPHIKANIDDTHTDTQIQTNSSQSGDSRPLPPRRKIQLSPQQTMFGPAHVSKPVPPPTGSTGFANIPRSLSKASLNAIREGEPNLTPQTKSNPS